MTQIETKALEKFAELMIEKIQTIQSDWKKPWFTEGVLSAPRNLSGRYYNGMNSLVLMMNMEKYGYTIPCFATFDRITAMNYRTGKDGKKVRITDNDGNELPLVSIRKGEKSFPVFITTFTCVHSETKEKIKWDDYKNLSDETRNEYNVYPRLNVYNVFNVEQTNIKESRPDLWSKLENQYAPVKPELTEDGFSLPVVDNMIKNNLWVCPIVPTYGNDAYYSISQDKIVVPEKKQFKDGESFYSNLFHEMAHSTGAESRLNRIKPCEFGSKEYAKEELVAELTAALVSSRLGMTKNIKEDSASYLKCWLDNLKEDAMFIKSVLFDVKRASHMIESKFESAETEEATTK